MPSLGGAAKERRVSAANFSESRRFNGSGLWGWVDVKSEGGVGIGRSLGCDVNERRVSEMKFSILLDGEEREEEESICEGVVQG